MDDCSLVTIQGQIKIPQKGSFIITAKTNGDLSPGAFVQTLIIIYKIFLGDLKISINHGNHNR